MSINMSRNQLTIVTSLMMVCLLAWASALADDNAKTTKVEGIIISSSGGTLIVTTSEGGKSTIVLTNDTKVQQSGIFNEKAMPATVLIPGLKVSAEGDNDDQNRLVAKEIDFDKGDLETAQKIQAGLHPTAEQLAANKEQTEQNKQQIEQNSQQTSTRFSDLSQYDESGDVNVNFPVGSSDISEQDKATLAKLAQDTANLAGYIIEVKGFADSSGSPVMNTKLSEDRAQTVVAYLVQQCNVPMRHIVSPAAMGETHAVATNETPSGRAENRRVEVKVLRNKGIAGNK